MMAKPIATVELTGWLNDVKQFSWGHALKVAIDQRKQNAQGEWETVDKTVYDVTTDQPVSLDGVKQVTVKGRIVGTSTFQKRDGSTGSAIRVRAESIFPAETEQAPVAQLWPEVKQVPDNAPF
jgi:hypothetical protein